MTIRAKRISKQQEQRAADELGGRTQANSGATRLGGGADVRAPGVRLECKVTEKDYYSIRITDLEKLRVQAAKTVEQPVFQIAFRDKLGKLDRYAIVFGFDVAASDVPFLNVVFTSDKSIKLVQFEISLSLNKFRNKLIFAAGKGSKEFELMRWEEFLRRYCAGD
jgi:hypothetical protein